MQSAGEHTSESPTSPMQLNTSTSSITGWYMHCVICMKCHCDVLSPVPSQSDVENEMSAFPEKEAIRVVVEKRRTAGNSETSLSSGAESLLMPIKCVDCERELSAEQAQQRKDQGEAQVCDTCRSAHFSFRQDHSDGKGVVDQTSADTRSSPSRRNRGRGRGLGRGRGNRRMLNRAVLAPSHYFRPPMSSTTTKLSTGWYIYIGIVHVYICVCMCTCVCACVCVHVCACVCVHVCMHSIIVLCLSV